MKNFVRGIDYSVQNRGKENASETLIQEMARPLTEMICTVSIMELTLLRCVINIRWGYQYYRKPIDRVWVYMDVDTKGI
jgi:hypothetical protein